MKRANHKHHSRIRFGGRRGQATIEVVLAAMISVIVILGLVYRFNKAFRQYTVDLYGNYYRCLLQTGELPGNASRCSSQQAAFNIANQPGLVSEAPGTGGSGNGGTGSSGSGPTRSSNGSSQSGSSASGSGAGRGSGSGGSGGSGGGSTASGDEESVTSAGGPGDRAQVGSVRGGRSGRSPSVTQVGSISGEDQSKEKEGEVKKSQLSTARSSSGQSGRQVRTKMDYYVDEEGSSATTAIPVSSVSTSSGRAVEKEDPLRPRRAQVKESRKVASSTVNDSDSGLSFGTMFRYFLIFILIAAVLFFFGGQMLQISKSAEK